MALWYQKSPVVFFFECWKLFAKKSLASDPWCFSGCIWFARRGNVVGIVLLHHWALLCPWPPCCDSSALSSSETRTVTDAEPHVAVRRPGVSSLPPPGALSWAPAARWLFQTPVSCPVRVKFQLKMNSGENRLPRALRGLVTMNNLQQMFAPGLITRHNIGTHYINSILGYRSRLL